MITPARATRGPRRRLFFALWAGEPFCQQLAETAAPVLSALPGRMLSPADWHVTLCFLGEVDEALMQPLGERAALIDARAFELRFERVEYWREARVIAASAAAAVPERALALAGALRAAAGTLGLRVDERPLRPHVTLSRGVPAQAGQGLAGALGVAGAGLDLVLAAREFHLAASLEPPPGPAAQQEASGGAAQVAAGKTAAGKTAAASGDVPRRYVTLARWPLRM